MAVHLVRHAVAVGRHSWSGDDFERPLTGRGRRQAEALVRLFKGSDIRRIRTSPAVRCRQTIGPLAAELGLDPVADEVLAEGWDTAGALELVRRLAAKKGDSVLCSHGDIIPEVVRRLVRDGTVLESDLLLAKGSTWELSVDDKGAITTARYHPPAE